MEYIVAFVMIFAGANLGHIEKVNVQDHAFQMCRSVYPEGQVDGVHPVTVTMESGNTFRTPHVFRCLRPKTDVDRLEEQKKDENTL